jgi:glutathione S-transferase
MTNQLFGLWYSPWTIKARWALDHHGVPYDYTEHVPMLGEGRLRWKARRPTGKVTVPLLVTDGDPIMDSLEIARYAERHGRGAPLFPAARRSEIDAWNARSERVLAAGRGLVVARTARSERAKEEALPPFVPEPLRAAMRPVATSGLMFFRLKYGLGEVSEGERRAVIAAELRALREALGGKSYLLGDFSYADVAMAVTLQLVRPADTARMRESAGTREAWADPALEEELGDLVAWRDEIYTKHRPGA